jgi:predicted transposase/invertase (TIGR01784 family)
MIINFNGRAIDPTNDFTFKYIFGNPAHSHLTLHFLNGIMRQLGRPQFRSLEITNPFRLADFSGGKDVVLDVCAIADDSHEVQVEMQIRMHAELPERMLDNWTRLYSRQLKKGENYDRHRPVYALWIINEAFGDDGDWLRLFELRDAGGVRLSDHLNILLLDLAAWRGLRGTAAGGIIDGELGDWLELLGSPQTVDAADLGLFAHPCMEEVQDIMATMSRSDRAWYLNEYRRKAILNQRSLEKQAYLEGKQAGEVIGEQRGKIEGKIETARQFLALGVPLETVLAATGVSQEQLADNRLPDVTQPD